MNPINLDVQRPSDELLQKFADQPAALLHEAMGKRGALTHDFKSIYPGGKMVGAALTIKSYPGDNLMLHRAISVAKPGDLLVATVGGFTEAGIWGEIAAMAAIAQGVRGLVTDGAVRDVDEIQKTGFPVFSRAVCMKGTTKRQPGLLNHPISIGGIHVRPGDIIVGDTDGVVVVPLDEAETVLEKAGQIVEFENRLIAGIKNGELTIDLLGLRPVLKELGLDD